MRPTGKLHIGHYFGALENWVRLQDAVVAERGANPKANADSSLTPGQVEAQRAAPVENGGEREKEFDCFYFIADWHALTSDYADSSAIAQNTIEIVTDYLAAGLDPEKSVIFQQSLVPEHSELHLLLSMVTPLGWLERVPTYKEAFENVKDKDLHTYGFLGYPCLQTADIVIYSEDGIPLFVPVGEDQVSHVEVSREIVRRFNLFNYKLFISPELFKPDNRPHLEFILRAVAPSATKGRSKALHLNEFSSEEIVRFDEDIKRVVREIGVRNFLELMGERRNFFNHREELCEPQHQLTKTPRLPGLDGRKMSKSYGNAITLSESDEDIRKKTKVMKTDPARQRRTDPGNPDVCPVFDWHKLFSSEETKAWAAEGCRTAGIGCIECKGKMADGLITWIAPVRERRLEYEKRPKRVLEVIDAGSAKARVVAQATMERVREAVFGWGRKRNEVLQ